MEELEEPVVGEEQEAATAPVVPPASVMREHQYAGIPDGDSARRLPPAKGQANKQHPDRRDAEQEQQSGCRHGAHRRNR